MRLSKRQLKRIIREEKRRIISELGPGAAYSRLRDMEPDPSDMMSQKTLSSVAKEHLNYLHPFMNEVEGLGSMDPRAGDISDLYFQLIERLNAVLEMRESGHQRRPFMSGGPEDDYFETEDEYMYSQIMRALEEDLNADPYQTGRAQGYNKRQMKVWLELWDDALEHIEMLERGGTEEPEEFYDPTDVEVDPERNYISGDFMQEPDYYDPEWGDSMREDY